MIVCVCRGKSEKDIARAIEDGATSLRDLQRCGIGDQCGSCHNSLRTMIVLAEAADAARRAEPCGACVGEPLSAAVPA